jgi:hypothetical protein
MSSLVTNSNAAIFQIRLNHYTIMSACLGSIWGTLKKAATTAAVSGAGKLAMVLLDKIRAFIP